MNRFVFLEAVMLTAVFISTQGRAESKVCWEKTWHNNSNPHVNGSEYESLSKTELAKICSNRAVIDARCADDKFEGFSGIKRDNVSHYNASCSVANGLECHPFKKPSSVCPDMAIQYGCECPTNTSSSTAAPVNNNTNTPASTGSPADPNQNQKQSENGHNNGIQNENSNACLLLVLLLVNSLY